MGVNSLKPSAQAIPPDIIGLASKLDLDNQPITFIIIFFLRNVLKINTELKHILLRILIKLLQSLMFFTFRRPSTCFGLYIVIIR